MGLGIGLGLGLTSPNPNPSRNPTPSRDPNPNEPPAALYDCGKLSLSARKISERGTPSQGRGRG